MGVQEGIAVADLVVGVLSLVVGTAVTFLVYRLGRRLDFRTRMHTWEELRSIVRKFAAEMHDQKLNTDVLLLNADRYERDYNGGNKFTRHGWIQLRAEYIDVRHNGVALLANVVPVWEAANGGRVLEGEGEPVESVLAVGLVPFEWIEHIAPDGNEFKNAPLIYVHFRGRGRSPFAGFTYHRTQSVPMGPRGRPYYPEITELGVSRVGRRQGWGDFWRQWWVDRKMQKDASPGQRRTDRG